MTIIELFQKLLRFKSITPNDDGAFDFIEEYLGDSWSCIKVDMEGVKNRFSHILKDGDIIKIGSNHSKYEYQFLVLNDQ